MRVRLCEVVALALLLCAVPARAQRLEDQLILGINAVRQDPRGYAERLRLYRGYFKGALLTMPGDPVPILTREGTAAVDEAIAFLERQAPLPPLERAPLLEQAAIAFAQAQGAIGGRGHVGQDGSTPGERVRRLGGNIYVGEGIAYGEPDAEALLREMVVDDGVPGRGHRVLLFAAAFRFAGVGCAPHTTLQHICVVEMSATIDGSPVRILVPAPQP
ncbi:CAP domain-containing protein [Sphingomonas sp. HT-1]|uniref:CAP domain-containing protein n=1 Tax=unclassified Sphingomonas TaxID=196159 RepID=UPI000319EC6B|nr:MULTISPECIES: CAP domain-containing protein [unclassified Sphingomonas]KTF70042.1 hypothetical protein ATB93_00845 [Sphingomonas sp. WG]